MPDFVKVAFDEPAVPAGGTLIVFVDESLRRSTATAQLLGAASSLFESAAEVAKFKGKSLTSLEILVPHGLAATRLVAIGLGNEKECAELDFTTLGGFAMGKLAPGSQAMVVFDMPFAVADPATAAADFALGLRLRAYRFDLYKQKKAEETDKDKPVSVTVGVADAAAARREAKAREAIADGVALTRNLINEPPNVLNPEEFARRAAELEELGVEVEVLDEKALIKLGMRALLGVGQGSHSESRVVVMHWHGGKSKAKPIAFVGKGVCFDSGGISIKPAGGMEDMKGDMAGAACVVGLMHTLAARKAKVNALGVVGLVENMPDGKAQRPGDIVRSMSGQTIEIINTDAEGRLVLADLLWYVQSKHKPLGMIDLATLTGAIVVALAQEYGGMFANDDDLAGKLEAAGKATGEKVWRMPLGKAYDKMIDSKVADMKNTGGRNGGSITAAQFLQRFVNDTPWVHLDIAGTALGSPVSETSQGWTSGWGVRLLNQMVADHYEK
jgi:leucyl aminopeptidase